MSWKFWKKDPEKIEFGLPMSTIYRWFCYDMGITDLSALDKSLELVSISPDGLEMELEESQMRLEEIQPIMPFIFVLSQLSALIMEEVQVNPLLENLDLSEDQLEEIKESFGDMYQSLSFSIMTASMSIANALGVLELTHGVTATIAKVDPDEYFK